MIHKLSQAFPVVGEGLNNRRYHSPGLSARDYFAAHAPEPPAEWMRLVCNHPNPYAVGGKEIAERIADWKYMIADAMLERGQG